LTADLSYPCGVRDRYSYFKADISILGAGAGSCEQARPFFSFPALQRPWNLVLGAAKEEKWAGRLMLLYWHPPRLLGLLKWIYRTAHVGVIFNYY
jgi:hypothetical protein